MEAVRPETGIAEDVLGLVTKLLADVCGDIGHPVIP